MSWFAVEDYPDKIFRITEPALSPLAGANVWLILGARAALLIDSGVGLAPLAPVVRAITPLPTTLLVTHTHYDHVGGAHEFPERRVHAAEAGALAAPGPETGLWRGWLTQACFARLPAPDFDVGRYALRPAPAAAAISDGDVLDLGGRRVEILHTPGHSPGLVCAFERASGALFSSDALYDGRMFFDLPGSDPTAARRSLERLRALRARTLYPGHYGPVAADRMPEVIARALDQTRV